MCFVDDSDPPGHISNDIKVAYECIICSDQDIELEVVGRMWTIFVVPLVLPQNITPDTLPIVVDATPQVGPTLEFSTPVLDRTQRDHHQEGTMHLLHAIQVLEV